MDLTDTKRLQKGIKDLILFNSCWEKRNQIKTKLQIPQKIIERIKIYRELVRNSLKDVVSNIYPYTRKVLKNKWNKLLPAYLEAYPPTSPILNRVAEHFPTYLLKQKNILKRYPFISELALYEWLELEVYEKENINDKKKIKNGFCLNPAHTIPRFQYPVPQIIEIIKSKKLTKLAEVTKQPTNVLIYRDPKTLTVRFFELSLATSTYLKLVEKGFEKSKALNLLVKQYKIDKNGLKPFVSKFDGMVKVLEKSKILVKI